MDIEDTKVNIRSTCEARCARNGLVHKHRGKKLGFNLPKQPTEAEIVAEARRCIFCYDAPCVKCCPTNLDVREFVHAAAMRNWYYAAKVIMNNNPLPLSTANLCMTEETCSGGCNLNNTLEGPIKISQIQKFAVRKFREYNIKPLPGKENGKKVAVIGSGPAGISCAVFLRRLGFAVTIFEKDSFAGGILTSEIIPNRLPAEDIEFDIQMAKDIGVEFRLNTEFGKDVTLESLEKDGYNATFLAFGRPQEIIPNFPCVGAKSSRQFLREICYATKINKDGKLPDFTGKKVCVLGAGDTAMDCASAAVRCGGNVTSAYRESFKAMQAHPEEVEEVLNLGVEFLSLAMPSSIENGTVTFRFTEYDEEKNEYRFLDEYITRHYDEVIYAYGAVIGDAQNMIPGKPNIQRVEGHNNVFIGGSLSNSVSVVEAVNDGKTAARMIADALGVHDEIPLFHTAVDDVSLATEFAGFHFNNPTGISSAPVSGTYECIRNCFRAGMGWAVTKTILLTQDVQRENDYRIAKCDEHPFSSGSYLNICMMTEHTAEYWMDAIRKLRAEFPDRVLIASIAASDNKAHWQELVRRVIEAGAQGIELNLSCPNEVHGEGGHKGGFDTENKIGMALGTHPISVKRITEYVCEVSTVPVFVKLTPNVTEPNDIAQAAIDGGATGVTLINTVAGIARYWPDGTPHPQVGKSKLVLSGGLSGEQVRPIVLRQMSRIYNILPDHPILGVGGIESAYTALQHLYAGANVFQLCSSVIRYSYDIVREVNAGLQFFLYSWSRPDLRARLSHWDEMTTNPYQPEIPTDDKQDRPVPTLAELRGLGAKHVVQREGLDNEWTVHAFIDQNVCLNCGKCALSCRDNSENCIELVDGKWKVVEDKCVGCGACVSVCPVQAVKLVESEKILKWHHQNDLPE